MKIGGNLRIRLADLSARTWRVLGPIIVAAVMSTAMLAFYFHVRSGVTDRFLSAEDTQVRRDVERVSAAFQQQISALDLLATDWAHWDDTYEFIAGAGNPEYIDSNITQTTFNETGLDLILISSADSEPIFATQYDGNEEAMGPLAPELDRLFRSENVTRRLEEEGAFRGLALVGGRPLQFSVQSVLTSEGDGPSNGFLVFGRWFDAELAQQLAQTTHFDIRALSPESVEITSEDELARAALSDGRGLFISRTNASRIAGYTQLPAEFGGSGLVIRVEQDRLIYGEGQAAQRALLLSSLFIGLILGALALFLHDRLFLMHVERSAREKRFAYEDSLTGLPNAALFADRLNVAIAQSKRRGRRTGVLVMDINNLKRGNEEVGRGAGDQLIEQVGDRLSQMVRGGDTVARLAGDEFAILTGYHTSPEDMQMLATRIIETLETPLLVDAQPTAITVALGGALYPNDGGDPDSLLRNATTAMYHRKIGPKSTFALFDTEVMADLEKERKLRLRLAEALEKNEFTLHYQPIIDLASMGVVGVEALIRWERPGEGLVSPATFIPLAEETGLIIPLGAWVLRRACTQLKALHDRGFVGLRVAINLSPKQIRDDFLDTLDDVLESTGLSSRYLELEITETAALEDLESTRRLLGKLKDRGVRIALDDFGTGYSSLSHLRTLQYDTVKIDRSFIQNLDEGTGRAIVEATIDLVRSLGRNVVAEGIETDDQISQLRKMLCDHGQGYGLAHPKPFNVLKEFLRDATDDYLWATFRRTGDSSAV